MPLVRPATVYVVALAPMPAAVVQVEPLSRTPRGRRRDVRAPGQDHPCIPRWALRPVGAAGKNTIIGVCDVPSSWVVPVMLTVSEIGLPAVAYDGRLAVSTATVKA